jgi:membrane-bound lytic murein transglycosylase B
MKLKFMLSALLLFFASASFAIDLSHHPEIRSYIEKLSKDYQFDQSQLTKWFNQVNFDTHIIEKMNAPAEVKPWYVYRNALITPDRITDGVNFWKQNEKALKTAEKRYGVPAYIIVGIIGVETNYGTNKGSFPVMSALTTLAFKYPKRASYFQSELTNFLLLSRELSWDPLTIKGSYAGAIGYPQFMPSSYRKYALDYDGDGKVDLIANSDDAILSIANYLKLHGWEHGKVIKMRANVKGDKYAELSNSKNPKQQYTVKQLKSYGVIPEHHVSSSLKANVIDLEDTQEMQHWLTFDNFKVIKTYNSSAKYAMAVCQLGEEISSAKKHGSKS